ncbi:hypothetical protein Gpo141_00007741 [Globisporangium polare]
MAAVHPFQAEDGGDVQPPPLGYSQPTGGYTGGYGYGGAPPPNGGYNSGALAQGGGSGVLPYGYSAPQQAGYAVGGAHVYPVPGNAVYPVGAAPPGYANYPPPGGAGNGGGQQPPPQQHQEKSVDPRNQIQTGRWTSGLCSCCDNCVPNLLMAWCCPCISLAQVYARLGLYRYLPALVSLFVLYAVGVIGNFIPSDSTETATYTYDPQTGSVVVTGAPSTSTMLLPITMAVGQSLFRLVVWQARSKVRERFQIPGSCIGDGCASCICSCCAIAQLATHVKSYTPGSCSFGGPDVLPAFP